MIRNPKLPRLPKRVDDQLMMIGSALTVLEQHLPLAAVSQQVDLAARIDALGKRAQAICERYKSLLWEQVKGEEGSYEMVGADFTARLTAVASHRFDTKHFAVKEPKLYQKYLTPCINNRTTFRPKG